MLIRQLAASELTGKSAANAVWTIFFRLVLQSPDHAEWIDGLGSEWLTELRKQTKKTTRSAH
jgi:hypothetical protein